MVDQNKSYRDLEVWQRSLIFVQRIYVITAEYPRDDIYGLNSQLRCAAVSEPSNIAEGHARKGSSEFQHFVSFALGSLAELETIGQMLRGLNKALRK